MIAVLSTLPAPILLLLLQAGGIGAAGDADEQAFASPDQPTFDDEAPHSHLQRAAWLMQRRCGCFAGHEMERKPGLLFLLR